VDTSLRSTIIRKLKLAYETALGQLYIDLGHDHRDTVLLAGSGRSGTTWVAEMINFDNSYRLIFEPLRAGQFKPFHGRRYLRSGEKNPILADLFRTIVDGEFRSLLADRYNRQPFPRKRLVKEIIINLSLAWLHRQFPDIPIILLIRHPYAVLASRLRLGWNYSLRPFLMQESLVADFLSPFKADMETVTSALDVHLYHWCIETLVPLKQLRPGEVHLAFYEDFCEQPRHELERLFAFLGKNTTDRLFRRVNRPSSQTWGRSPLRSARLAGLRDNFSSKQLQRTDAVLREFGLDVLYDRNGEPNHAAALAFSSVAPSSIAPLIADNSLPKGTGERGVWPDVLSTETEESTQ
jgi:hypothetical protein